MSPYSAPYSGTDLIVANMVDRLLGLAGLTDSSGFMVVKNYHMVKSSAGGNNFASGFRALGITPGDLGMVFRDFNPVAFLAAAAPLLAGVPIAQSLMAVYQVTALADSAAWVAAAALRLFKGAHWADGTDPLVIDLDGDGIETVGIGDANIYFDVDGDLFRERTGWLKGDDGFLVLDANQNGRIDDISEMFGGVGASGFAELATLDANGDGKITIADAVYAELRIWQDRDQDGVTDAGELKSLSQLGIVSLDVVRRDLNVTTPQGAQLTGYGDVTFANGVTRRMFDAVFASNNTDTEYGGESGAPTWATTPLNAKGFGSITDLAVAMANDADLGQLASSTAAAMTAPKLQTLVQQAGAVLGAWGSSLELTRELFAMRLSADGKVLLERQAWDGAACREKVRVV